MSTTLEAPAVGKKFKFKLLRGRHIEGVKPDVKAYQVEKDPVTKFPICPIIETDKDLGKLFNQEGVSPKFERIYGEPTPVPLNPLERMAGESVQAYNARLAELMQGIKQKTEEQAKAIDKLSKEDLESFAEENEIDLRGVKTLEQMRVAVKTALKG